MKLPPIDDQDNNSDIRGAFGPYASSVVDDNRSISTISLDCGTGNHSIDIWSSDVGVFTVQGLDSLTSQDMTACFGTSGVVAYAKIDGICQEVPPDMVISSRTTFFNNMDDCESVVNKQCNCKTDAGGCSPTVATLPQEQVSSINENGGLSYCPSNTRPVAQTILTPRTA